MEWIDLLLVALTFYFILNWARRRQAVFLIRGALLLAVVMFIVTIVLPFPTFDWLMRGLLIAMLIAAPVIFHPELRRLLERLGRHAGLSWAVRQTAAEHVVAELVKAMEALAIKETGALVAIEGQTSLADIIDTGVPIGARVTHDLLQTIFYGENPLHDGAVIIQEDRLVAASCVLPLTQRSLAYADRRFGTRHRAAVGLSETSDAFVIVVSEESGNISVTRNGQLYRHQNSNDLRDKLVDFHLPHRSENSDFSWRRLIQRLTQRFKAKPSLPTRHEVVNSLMLLVVAFLFALTFWAFVIEQTNPPRRELVENIPLRVEDTPAGMILLNPPPDSVSAVVQTTDQALPTLRPASFQAVASLADIRPGLHRLDVQVNPSLSEVRILSVDPAVIDVEAARVISRTMPVDVDISNQENMSPAYQVVRTPTVIPDQVQVSGPAPLVEQINQIQTDISLANVTASLQELRPVEAVDEAGRVIRGVSIQPAQVQVRVTIQRRLNAIDVGIRAITQNSPPPGYWLSDLQVDPTTVTLQGNPGQLADIAGYIDTLPVDISEAVGDLNVQIPLDLPPGIQAIDSDGNPIRTVNVLARVTARTGDLPALQQPVELLNVPLNSRVTVTPPTVDLLLSGPQPTLNDIAQDPDLIRVVVDTLDLSRGQNIEVTPDIILPSDIEAQIIPATVLVSFPEEE